MYMYFTFRFKEEHLELFDRVIETLLQEKWDTFVRFRFFRRMIWLFVYAAIFLTAFLLRPGTDNFESLWVTFTVNVLEILKKSDHLAKDHNVQSTTPHLSADCIQRSKCRHKHSEQGSKKLNVFSTYHVYTECEMQPATILPLPTWRPVLTTSL